MGKNIVIIIAIAVILIGGGLWLASDSVPEEVIPDDEEVIPDDGEMVDENGEEALMGVLGKTADIGSLQYEVKMESPEMSHSYTVWQKGPKMRVEGDFEGYRAVVLLDHDEKSTHLYLPDQNTATRLSWDDQETAEAREGSLTQQSAELPDQNPVVLGSETLDGKDCLVVEYTPNEAVGKMWIWKDHGLPIRAEQETQAGLMEMWAEDISFDDVPDDMFELPEGVQIIDIPSF